MREGLWRHLLAFDAMQRVAAVNRGLALLASGGPKAAKKAGRGPAFLRNSATWLRERVGHLAALVGAVVASDGLPAAFGVVFGP